MACPLSGSFLLSEIPGQSILRDRSSAIDMARPIIRVEQHIGVEAAVCTGVAGRSGLIDDEQYRICVAIQFHLTNMLGVSRSLSLDPVLLARARPVRRTPGTQGAGKRLLVHPGEHEDVSSAGLLSDGWHETSIVLPQTGSNGGVEARGGDRTIMSCGNRVPTGRGCVGAVVIIWVAHTITTRVGKSIIRHVTHCCLWSWQNGAKRDASMPMLPGKDTTMSLAQSERAGLAGDLDRLGPDAPTLDKGWTTNDLLTHMLLRENDPLAIPGMAVDLLDETTTARARRLEASTTFDERVAQFRRGPKPWSAFRIPLLDRVANGAEFFVHHEDVLRAEEGWSPRELGHQTQTHLARIVKQHARLLLRRSPVGVRVEMTGQSGDLHTLMVRPGSRIVTVVGEPAEVLLHCYGRKSVAQVTVLGERESVEAFLQTECSV